MQRITIYLEDRQTAALDEVARGRAITRTELVRQYIGRGLTETPPTSTQPWGPSKRRSAC